MSYDEWKLRSPDQEPGADDGLDCELECDGPDEGDSDRGCVLGAECLHPDPFHLASECFDVEMAESFMATEDAPGGES